MSLLEEFKKENPSYANVPDGKLAYGLWNKYYKDKQVPMGIFADKVGLSNDDFKMMLDFSNQSGYKPTGRTFAEDYVPEGSAVRSALQGQALGYGDEIVGGMTAAAQKLGGDERSFSDLYSQAAGNERAMLEQYRKAAPVQSALTEVGGALLNPLGAGGKATSLKTGATAAGTGFIYGTGATEGDIRKRLEGGIENGVVSGLFGMASQKLLNATGNAFNRLNSTINVANKRPTVESLKRAKNEAYKLVDQDGTIFGLDDMSNIYKRASSAVQKFDFDPEADKQVLAVARALQNKQGSAMTLSQLDNFRSDVLWKRYNAADDAQKPMIREIISVVDDVIDSKLSGGNTVLQKAREANSRFKKSELLEEAFNMAQLETAGAGSGGNITNKYRQAVKNILKNPKKSKWFTPEEISVMEAFIKGTVSDNTLRLVGKLSPSGNGLMLALNVIGATIEPTALAGAAVGAGAKMASDARTRSGAESLIGTIGGYVEKPVMNLAEQAPAIASYSNLLRDEEERK